MQNLTGHAYASAELSHNKATPALISEFSQRATKLLCTRKIVLFERGEPAKQVYLVRSGRVELTMPITSDEAMAFRAAEGSIVGLPAAFSNEPYSLTALAYRGAELEEMDRRQFWEMLISKPALSLDVLKILASETRSARIAIVDVRSKHRHGNRRKGD